MTGNRRMIAMKTLLLRFAASTLTACAFATASIAQAPAQRTFPAPEDAVKALVDTVKVGNLDGLLAIFGSGGQELIDSSDAATARQNQKVFTVAVAERWRLEDSGTDRKTLIIGNEDWPFPVPIVKDGSAWRFDTVAGKEEILARRIGRNELAAIDTARAYVTAQKRYAEQGHDGKAAGLYAVTLLVGIGAGEAGAELSLETFVWIVAATVVALSLPNTQEFLGFGNRKATALTRSRWERLLVWRPGFVSGVILGAMTFLVIRRYFALTPTEFLYFKF